MLSFLSCLYCFSYLTSAILFKADEKFQRRLEGKSNKDRTSRIAAEAEALAAQALLRRKQTKKQMCHKHEQSTKNNHSQLLTSLTQVAMTLD
jgi:hypothetical protein